MEVHFKSDERILGKSDFVEEALSKASEELENRYRLKAKGCNFNAVVKRVADIFELEADQILLPGKNRQRVLARSVLAYWAVRELGISGTDVGKKLGLSQPTISRSVQKGERIVKKLGLLLI